MRSKEQENKRRQRRRKKQLERAIHAQSVSLDGLAELHPRGVVSFDLEMAGAFPDDIIEMGPSACRSAATRSRFSAA